MVAQNFILGSKLSLHRLRLSLILSSFVFILPILSLLVQAESLDIAEDGNCHAVDEHSSYPGPAFAKEMKLFDQTQQSINEQSWEAGLSIPRSNEEPFLRHQLNLSPPLSWIRKHLGTKSPYPHEDKPVGPVSDIPKGYELVQLHMICRHGTRYPSSSKSIIFQKLTEKLRQTVVPGFEWLQKWPSEKLYPITKGNLLSAKGDSDLYRIGRRFAIRYKEFLDRYPYDANTYEFQSSSKSRCSQSAYGFSVGFLEGHRVSDTGYDKSETPPVQPVDIFTLPIGLDKELAVKYACPRWLESVKNSPKVVQQKLSYQEKFLPELADRLSVMFSTRDGSAQINVTTKDVETIYGICGFEVAFHNNDQTWCQLLRQSASGPVTNSFDNENSNFLRLEISNDLDDYYTYGPGVPFNRHLGCELGTALSDAIEDALSLESELPSSKRKSDDDDGPYHFRGLFKFGHSETILFLSSFLGLYNQKGVPLRGDMTPEQYAQREFRSSKVSPFAANIAFEVFRPKHKNLRNKKRVEYDENRQESILKYDAPKGLVRLLVNEEPLLIPGCGSDYFCEWATLKSILRHAGAGCDFDGCCASLVPSEVLSRVFESDPICLSVEPVTSSS